MTAHISYELWSDYLDGLLAEGERGGVEAHLAACASCSAELARIRGVLEKLGGLDDPGVPGEDLWPAIANRLQAQHFPASRSVAEGRTRAGAGRRERRLHRFTSAQLAAAAVLLLALGACLGWLAPRRAGGADAARRATRPEPGMHSPGRLAERVQSTGSDYVANLAALRGTAAADSAAAAQGREAAISVLIGAATELGRMSPRDPGAPALQRIARQMWESAADARPRPAFRGAGS